MNNVARVFATGIVWGALTILGVAMMMTRVEVSSGLAAFMMTILIVGATIATSSIWRSGNTETDVREQSEKAKRRSRVERLMSDLDERDIDELRYRLMGDQDEDAVPLEDLMQSGRRR
jgi:hypothetical protein